MIEELSLERPLVDAVVIVVALIVGAVIIRWGRSAPEDKNPPTETEDE